MCKPLELPPFYDAANASNWDYAPNVDTLFSLAKDWRRQFGITDAAQDERKIRLLLIDLQKDFCFKRGALYVGGRSGEGAIRDNARIAEFIHRYIYLITEIITTLDTHVPFQIFFPSFWLDEDGNYLLPFDIILDDLTILRGGKPAGKARVNPAMARILNLDYGWLVEQAAFYCRELIRMGSDPLCIWTYHCLEGSPGHALAGVIDEARMLHSFVRQVQAWIEIKGLEPLSEKYSIFQLEVMRRFDGTEFPDAQNEKLLCELMAGYRLIVAGQAGSHCEKKSLDHLLEYIQKVDPALASQVYIMIDCTSAVTVPNPAGGFFVDCTETMENAFAKYAEAGMHLVKSTDPIESWPGMEYLAKAA